MKDVCPKVSFALKMFCLTLASETMLMFIVVLFALGSPIYNTKISDTMNAEYD
jgi:hypothetical protein